MIEWLVIAREAHICAPLLRESSVLVARRSQRARSSRARRFRASTLISTRSPLLSLCGRVPTLHRMRAQVVESTTPL